MVTTSQEEDKPSHILQMTKRDEKITVTDMSQVWFVRGLPRTPDWMIPGYLMKQHPFAIRFDEPTKKYVLFDNLAPYDEVTIWSEGDLTATFENATYEVIVNPLNKQS